MAKTKLSFWNVLSLVGQFTELLGSLPIYEERFRAEKAAIDKTVGTATPYVATLDSDIAKKAASKILGQAADMAASVRKKLGIPV